MHDPYADVAQEVLAAREDFYQTIKAAYDAGFPLGRLIELIGYQNCAHILGPETCEPWRIDRGYAPRRQRDLRQHPPAPTPTAIPRSRNT